MRESNRVAQPEADPVDETTTTATCPNCGWYLSANRDFTAVFCERCDFSKPIQPSATTPTTAAVAAAREIVPDCLSRTCFIKDCSRDHCWGCDDAEAERERVATIISRYTAQQPEVEAAFDEIIRERDQLSIQLYVANEALKLREQDYKDLTAANRWALGVIERLTHEVESLKSDIVQFWLTLERCWEIEPRAYFEKEARENGFGSPLAMAVHYMWKRDTKTVTARANAIGEAIEIVDSYADSIGNPSTNIAAALEQLKGEKGNTVNSENQS